MSNRPRRKRRFGRVRQLPSGRYQARYRDPTGIDRPAPITFLSKTDAERWLTGVEADILKGTWRNPDHGRILLDDYLTQWIKQRPGLRPRTVELYQWTYHKHIKPYLASHHLGDITPGTIRAWHAELTDAGLPATMTAKAYRLLRAVLNTAVDDELITRNPCRIKGAGIERAPERPTATIAQVFDIAGRVPARFRVLILLAAFTSLRYGELAALRRQDIGPRCATLTVRATLVELSTGRILLGPPKTEAGKRTVTVPTSIRRDLRAHLRDYVADDPEAFVFTGVNGAMLRRSNFQRAAHWTASVTEAGLPGFHFHDLRHTGNTLASQGASLADLMARMGHSSTRAAVIYQHAAQARDRDIADSLSARISQERDRARNGHKPRKQ